MKKIILLLWAAACVMTACQEKKTFTVTGTFATDDKDGQTVYLQSVDSNFRVGEAIDSVIVEKGKFVFSGIAKELPAVQIISMGEAFNRVAFIAEKGKIELDFDADFKSTLKGTAMNEQYQQFETEKTKMIEEMVSAREQKMSDIANTGSVTSKQIQEVESTAKQFMEALQNFTCLFIKPQMSTPAGQYFFLSSLFDLSDEQQKELISLATPEFRQLERVQQILERIEVREATAVEKQFTDVKGFGLDGKEVSLSDYAGKGKIVLVDFWASWCGPCRRTIPGLIKIYQQYKNKGFEIVGISLDDNKDKWKNITDELKITWPQLSNLKGWKEDGAVAYGINFIPQTVLIDGAGKIIERNISEEKLKITLEELLEKK